MSQYGRVPEAGKISIKSLDDGTLVTAQYNPKELQIDITVPWSPTGEANKANNQSNSGIHLEFTGAQGRSLSVELLFDGYEPKGYHVNVASEVKKLEKLASVREPESKKEDKRRPHHCVAAWGGSLKAFKCVIESLSTKYTMFDSSGNPLRATCTVKLREADSIKAGSGDSAGGGGGGGGG
jgi:hypothetical protein